jgi:hypothetical protein
MRMLAHRGHWLQKAEQNTMAAFRRALEGGHGIETDIRDCAGRLVVAHDPPGPDALDFATFLALAMRHPHLPLALNIKADGLAGQVTSAMRAAGHECWFAFDMSVPDTLAWRRLGAPYLTRRSEYEEPGRLDDDATGVWLDAFHGEWWDQALLEGLLDGGRIVAVVSPELHGRAPEEAWSVLRRIPATRRGGLMLCTDFPDRAGG